MKKKSTHLKVAAAKDVFEIVLKPNEWFMVVHHLEELQKEISSSFPEEEAKKVPWIFDRAVEAVKQFGEKQPVENHVCLSWSQADAHAVQLALMRYCLAANKYLEKYAGNEKHSDVLEAQEGLKRLSQVVHNIERQLTRQGFTPLPDDEAGNPILQ